MVKSLPQGSILDRWDADTEVRGLVGDILHNHGIVPTDVALFNQCKPGYPRDGGKILPALYVHVDAGETNPIDTWSAARRDLTALLDERGHSDIEVEIQDPQRFYMPSLFPVRPDDPAVSKYESVREAILRTVSQRIGSFWQMISLFRTGRDAAQSRLSIVLMVSPLAEHDWQSLVTALDSVANRDQPINQRLRVEVMPGTCQASVPPYEQQSPGISFRRDLDSHPRIGTSIGVTGEAGGGTLGGYLKLTCRGRTHEGFLTNFHVVAPAMDQSQTARDEYDAYGLDYGARSDNIGGTNIQYFASADVISTKGDIEVRLKDVSDEITSTTDRKLLDRLKVTQTNLENQLRSVQDMPRHLGRTIVSSGRGLTSKRRTLDYAFVESPSFHVGKGNNLSEISAGLDPRDHGVHRPLNLSDRIQGFSQLQTGGWYFKVGRTTGVTAGVCNGIEAYVKIEQVHHLLDASGMIIERRDAGYAEELVIINAKPGLTSSYFQSTFNDKGDSGSLIIDRNGNIAGLLWGEITGGCGPIVDERERITAGGQYVNAGLVTDIQDVIESIGQRTRSAVGVPGKLNVLSDE